MAEVAIKLPKEKIVEGLASLSVKEIKEIMDSLIQKKLLRPPSAKKIHREASAITKKKKLPTEVAGEAIKWARAKK